MNEMNSLETQLHSWQPRRPSAGLKRRLFAGPVNLMPKMAWFVGWLVPATACAVLTFSVFISGNELPGRSSRQAPLVATLLSNQNYLTPAPDSFRQGQNSLLSLTFDLTTNRSGPTSTISAFPRSGMN
jgi:hypothetical protein